MTLSNQSSRIRSFVRREGRITPAQERALVELWPRYGVDYGGELLDLGQLFPSKGDLYLEVGFGNGDALVEMAKNQQKSNFLGLEVYRPGVGHLLLEIDKLQLKNVRVARADAVEFISSALPLACLAGVFVFFPDPWPKKRHQKRRLIGETFLREIALRLQPRGVFQFASDNEEYAEWVLHLIESESLLKNLWGRRTYANRPDTRPITKYERRGLRLGHKVWDVAASKTT